MSDTYIAGTQHSKDGGVYTNQRVWDPDTLSWVAQTISSVGAVPASVEITNWPAIQEVEGTVDIGNFPESQTVDGTVAISNFPATQPISGSISVSNFPATQTVDGTVAVSSLPALPAGANDIGTVHISGTVPVSGTFWQATQPVSLASLPALAAGGNTIGSIANTTFAVTQSGTWNVGVTKAALTPASPATASVGVSNAEAVAANGSRKGLIITNLSNNTVSLGLGAAAVLNSGITLMPYGTWQMDEYTFCTSAINGIASAASSTISVQEFS